MLLPDAPAAPDTPAAPPPSTPIYPEEEQPPVEREVSRTASKLAAATVDDTDTSQPSAAGGGASWKRKPTKKAAPKQHYSDLLGLPASVQRTQVHHSAAASQSQRVPFRGHSTARSPLAQKSGIVPAKKLPLTGSGACATELCAGIVV
jgi:hypothetical protein